MKTKVLDGANVRLLRGGLAIGLTSSAIGASCAKATGIAIGAVGNERSEDAPAPMSAAKAHLTSTTSSARVYPLDTLRASGVSVGPWVRPTTILIYELE